MLRARVSARAVVLHGELYVVGGWDGRSVLQVLPHSLNHARTHSLTHSPRTCLAPPEMAEACSQFAQGWVISVLDISPFHTAF